MLSERLQALVDRGVEGSPRARELLAQLDGRRMEVLVHHTPFRVSLLAAGGQLRLLRDSTADADVRLSGTPLALQRCCVRTLLSSSAAATPRWPGTPRSDNASRNCSSCCARTWRQGWRA